MEKRYQRVLEIAPGLLIWLLLVFPIIGSIFIPQVVGFFFLVLTLYLFYKSILTLAGMIVGYATYRYSMKKNWLKECQRLDYAHLPDLNLLPVSSTLPKHLIVIANYGEDYSVVYRTMKAITEENYPKELIYVAFSIEERKAVVDEEYRRREGYLRRDFGEYFADRFFFFIHPADMDGEVPGAASNRTWAAKHAVEILEAKGCDIGEFLVTAPDGDTVFHPDYLASVTYKWLTAQKRNNKFYQTGIYRFNNNYWRVPTLIRILSMDLTLQTLGSSVFETKSKETFSCYTLNLRVLKEAHYWDVSLPIDDSIFFWRAFNHFNGEWECVVFFTPIDNDAVHADNYLLAYMKQYQQYLRWGFGIIGVPLAAQFLIENKHIKFRTKVSKFFNLFETYVLLRVLIYLVVVGPFLLLLLNPSASGTYPHLLPRITGIAASFVCVHSLFKALLTPYTNKRNFLYMLLIACIEIPLNLVAVLTLGTIPFVDASTRFMCGDRYCKSITWTEKSLSFEGYV